MKMLAPFALASLSFLTFSSTVASAQIQITETLDVHGDSLSLFRPGRILERLYTGSWRVDWSVTGTLHGGDATTSHTLRIRGVVGSGAPDFLGDIDQCGPIPRRNLSTVFHNVQVGDSVSDSGSLQGTVVNFAGNPVVGGLGSEERWHIVTAHRDYNTDLNGSIDYSHSYGRYQASGRFDGTLTLTHEVYSHPSTLVCAGGAELASYGDYGRLYYLHTADLAPWTAALLIEGQPAPATSAGLCLGGGVRRVPGSFQVASASGSYLFEVDSTAYPAGATSAFQLWYRTPNGTEFSDAIEVQLH